MSNFPDLTKKVLSEVSSERNRQDVMWGTQEHEPSVYFAILAEEVGEVAEEINEMVHDPRSSEQRLKNMREELIQVAAVAVAFIERLDRMKKKEFELEDGCYYMDRIGNVFGPLERIEDLCERCHFIANQWGYVWTKNGKRVTSWEESPLDLIKKVIVTPFEERK